MAVSHNSDHPVSCPHGLFSVSALISGNFQTREELRDALDSEIRTFSSDRDLAGNALIAWNHHEFEVQYQCLAEEVRIGDYYLRLLLEKEDCPDSLIRRSYEFFNDLYHRFLLTSKPEMKCMCLQAMSIVYGRHHKEIGPFSDTKYILGMLDRVSVLQFGCLTEFYNDEFLHLYASPSLLVLQRQGVYGGTHSLWWYSQFMVVLTVYGGAHSLWWYSQFMVVLTVYGGTYRLWWYS